MLIVARKTDITKCPAHAKGTIDEGYDEVLVCFEPVARKGDKVLCEDGSIDEIVEGDDEVLIGGEPVACKGHKTAHGGVILTGCPAVWIGRSLRGLCKIAAAEKRAAFIKYTVQNKRAPFILPTGE
ncbi:PAAR domain-containing protein [Polyangium spumosum]|uniref:PAAR domain-containing protein n=1 Tax=Polyangium spumosum TaxID=889282 RepID=A0A6N7PZQ1_9BACT|nr:PAAR domain-containing protein [Polyangium spumosum]MRG96366.1 hypothetical protein [Polyangium spumosum]